MDNVYLSINEINNYIKNMFEHEEFLNNVYLKGEISNFKRHTRGHLYFSLKDETSKISAVMFYNNALNLNFEPVDGDQVLITGRISLYEVAGTYQIYVTKMEKDGLGNLFVLYEQLKQKLSAKGYFNIEHKKDIPKYPTKIGVITAKTGAAVKDIISTIKRRFPIAEIILFPSLVQGALAANNIASQIKCADKAGLDVIICGRGGGSIEDLWAFNEEIVADAIYHANTPIISAVGHEVDFTIADLVADLRAPTPTGAAEMCVPLISEVKNYINQLTIRSRENINNNILINKQKLNKLITSYVLKNPLALYEIKEQKLDNLIDKLNNQINNLINLKTNRYMLLINTLKLVNPLNILKSGYSMVSKDESVITSVKNISKDDLLNIRVSDGLFIAKVEEIKDGK